MRSPANRSSTPSRISDDLGVAELGALDRVEDPLGLRADGLPALGVQGEQRGPVVLVDLAREDALEDRRPVLLVDALGERGVDRRDAAARARAAAAAATEAPRAIVKSYWNSTAARAASRARSVRTSLV